MKTEKVKVLLYLPVDLVDKMKKIKEENGIPLSMQVKKALEKWLKGRRFAC
jgi:hypothetical protein